MRGIPIIVVLAALAAMPGASAMDPITVSPPPVEVTIAGQSLHVDSSDHASAGPAIVGDIETQAVDLNIQGPRCTIDPSAKLTKGKVTHCNTSDVQAPPAPDVDNLVDADFALRLSSNENAPSEGAATEVSAAEAARVFSASPTVLLAAAAAGASMLGLYAAWRALKWTGIFALLPLYSHIRDDEILDDANRAGIFALIRTEPGISTKDVADRLHLAWGTVTHHLGKLEKRRFVVSKKYGKYRRYFANGEGGTEQKDQVAVLRLDRTGDIATLIRAQPGLTQKAVSNALGVSSSTILWHVKRLEGAQLITKVREGKLVRYYPAAGLATALVAPLHPTA